MNQLIQCYKDLQIACKSSEKFINNIELVCEKSINVKSKYKSLTLYNRKGFDNRYTALNINGVIVEAVAADESNSVEAEYRFVALQPKSVNRIDIRQVKNMSIEDYDLFEGFDGSTITLYYNSATESWELMNSTHIFAASCTYFDPAVNLNDAFQLALGQAGVALNYEDLNQSYCYSFLLAHPGWHPLRLEDDADKCTKIALIQALNLDTLAVCYNATPAENVANYDLPGNLSWLRKYTAEDLEGLNLYTLINERNSRGIVIMRHKSGYDCSEDNTDYYIEPVYFKNIKDIFYNSKLTDINECIIYSILSRDTSKHITLTQEMPKYYNATYRRFTVLSQSVYRSLSYLNADTVFDNEDAYNKLIKSYKSLVDGTIKTSTPDKSTDIDVVEYARFVPVFHSTMYGAEMLSLCKELIITKPATDEVWSNVLDNAKIYPTKPQTWSNNNKSYKLPQ